MHLQGGNALNSHPTGIRGKVSHERTAAACRPLLGGPVSDICPHLQTRQQASRAEKGLPHPFTADPHWRGWAGVHAGAAGKSKLRLLGCCHSLGRARDLFWSKM